MMRDRIGHRSSMQELIADLQSRLRFHRASERQGDQNKTVLGAQKAT